MRTFDFGENWCRFAKMALTAENVDCARRDFNSLMGGIELNNSWFLDVGFGQGLSMFCAAERGARVVGLDINTKNLEAVVLAGKWFPNVDIGDMTLQIGSILSDRGLSNLGKERPSGYDVVHSWGVLHHTGNMALALRRCAELLKPGGHLVVSIYNKHWTSPLWRQIKFIYCHTPAMIQKCIVYTMAPIIWLAKLLITGKNPSNKTRGMDFLFDVVDWVGGYPYEYASIEEFTALCIAENLAIVRVGAAAVPTGCNEFVFIKS